MALGFYSWGLTMPAKSSIGGRRRGIPAASNAAKEQAAMKLASDNAELRQRVSDLMLEIYALRETAAGPRSLKARHLEVG